MIQWRCAFAQKASNSESSDMRGNLPILPTPEAVEAYNKLAEKEAAGGLDDGGTVFQQFLHVSGLNARL